MGIFFLIAPFPDLCLLVPFFIDLEQLGIGVIILSPLFQYFMTHVAFSSFFVLTVWNKETVLIGNLNNCKNNNKKRYENMVISKTLHNGRLWHNV